MLVAQLDKSFVHCELELWKLIGHKMIYLRSNNVTNKLGEDMDSTASTWSHESWNLVDKHCWKRMIIFELDMRSVRS